MNENQKIMLGIFGITAVATLVASYIKELADKKLVKKQ